MRVTTNPVPITGEAVALDPAAPRPFIEAAGNSFVTTDAGTVIYRNADGHVYRAYPGWLVIVPDDGGEPHFTNPGNLAGEGRAFSGIPRSDPPRRSRAGLSVPAPSAPASWPPFRLRRSPSTRPTCRTTPGCTSSTGCSAMRTVTRSTTTRPG